MLDNLRYGNITDDQAHCVFNKCMENKSDEEKLEFKDALYLFQMWKLSHPIVLKYLKGFTEPMAKMRAKYETSNDRGVNHCVNQSSLPQRLALCVGAMVMLLQIVFVEHNIMNGSVGMVQAIIY